MTLPEVTPLYRTALGKTFTETSAADLYVQHVLLERYFAVSNEADRQNALMQLTRLRPDVPTLGKIIRIRLGWQSLAPGVYYINEQTGRYPTRFFLGIPRAYDRAKSWPLVIKLPTPAAAFITDPPPDADAVTHIYSAWIIDELTAHPDAIIAMPLLNLTEGYGPGYEGTSSVTQTMYATADKTNIDPQQVYLVGHAMASHATWNLALHYPTYFAAFDALAGGITADWQGLRLSMIRNVYPVIWHDSEDKIVPVSESRELVDSLRRLKIDVDYTETHGVGHAPPLQVLGDLYKKMRARQRELYPSHVTVQSNRPDTIFNRNDWVQVYQPLDAGNEQDMHIPHSTGSIRLNQHVWTLDAIADHNTINLTTNNIDAIRLYFNPDLVDLSKPIIVNINHKMRFNAIVPMSLDEMLKDQLFLGRGWRYYPAVLDIDVFVEPTPRAAGAKAPAPAAGAGAAR